MTSKADECFHINVCFVHAVTTSKSYWTKPSPRFFSRKLSNFSATSATPVDAPATTTTVVREKATKKKTVWP